MESYKAAVVQMNSQPDISHNLNQAGQLIREGAEKGAKLVCLPENFAFLGDFDMRIEKADEISDKALTFLKNRAVADKIYLLGGSFPVPVKSGKVLNRSLVIGPEGDILAKYDKIHLFDVDLDEGESYRESNVVEPGDPSPTTFHSGNIGHLGLSVCYDLRFPELYRELVDRGSEILTVPSAFTQTTGEVHWEVLLRARAIENTCYVLAPAQWGRHGARRMTFGHSLIVDPWGEVLAEQGSGTGVITAHISSDRLEEVRRSIPSLKHRRLK